MASDKGLIPSIAACISFAGVGAWLEANWAALISAGCSVGILLVNWYYRHREIKLQEMATGSGNAPDEHEENSI